jgi:hypothetical protein
VPPSQDYWRYFCRAALGTSPHGALRDALGCGLRGAWHTVARLAKDASFVDRSSEEQRTILDAVMSLAPDRGEDVAIGRAKSSARSSTR